MIKFIKLKKDVPYLILKEKYDEAFSKGQKNIEAIAISSYNKGNAEVESRFVNLKFVEGDEFIFFSNYNSPKSVAFKGHDQISALIYWESINAQIRIKAKVKKKSAKFNQEYFEARSIDKNALAISSNQSKEIESFEEVIENYYDAKNNKDLKKCPGYWGGFSFTPYYIEFWEGNKSRLNKRNVYKIKDGKWHHSIIQP